MRGATIFLAAALAAVFSAHWTPAAAEERVVTHVHGAWSVEIVTFQGRAACSVFTGGETGPAFIMTMTDDSPYHVPVFEVTAGDRTIQAGEIMIIAADGYEAEAAAEILADDDGVHIAAYPEIDAAPALVEAMLIAREVRLLRRKITLMALALDGFPAAYREMRAACG